MKKLFAFVMAVMLLSALVAGCGTTAPGATETPAVSTEAPVAGTEAPVVSTEAPTADVVKTGLAVVTSVSGSKDAAADAAGVVQGYSTIAAVTVDAEGKIVSCVIDAAQTKVNFDTAGVVTTALDTEFQTKNELGEGYGMKAASSIGKEWNEQAAAFAAYVIGKTAEEVQGIAMSEGYAADADLKASVTVHITDFIEVVAKAVANAQELGASSGDILSVGTVTNIDSSKNASADAEGLVQVYNTYAAVTKKSDGVITSCIIDASQAKVNFDTTGKITTDISVTVATKNEIGEGYGMKAASSIGKEWNEQAAAFAAYVTGKTAAEVEGIAMSEGYAADADLKASVTVHVTDFIKVVAKAAK
ncbi:MAG TPA: hypothetical protein VN608_06625 [Clostridia bacterium]|nr:hypothetical protein [Clostridia bacterium]